MATDFMRDIRAPFAAQILEPLRAMQWYQVCTFCERVYRFCISEVGWHDDSSDEWHVTATKQEVQADFAEQLNAILVEEHIAYRFVDGEFQRQGRAQTQKNLQRVGTVLGLPQLRAARKHFVNAQKFFDHRPEPDLPNCVKEALCALEAALEVLSQKPASNEFTKVVKQLLGNHEKQIPPPIAEGMIRLHAYRGSGTRGRARSTRR